MGQGWNVVSKSFEIYRNIFCSSHKTNPHIKKSPHLKNLSKLLTMLFSKNIILTMAVATPLAVAATRVGEMRGERKLQNNMMGKPKKPKKPKKP